MHARVPLGGQKRATGAGSIARRAKSKGQAASLEVRPGNGVGQGDGEKR